MKLATAAILVLGLSGCIDPAPRDPSMSQEMSALESEVLVVESRPSPSPARLAASCRIPLTTAIETALGKVKGQALNAKIELENGKALIEVTILLDGKVWEVEIDGTSGDVIEVEQEDDDDEDEDDDGDDD